MFIVMSSKHLISILRKYHTFYLISELRIW